MCIVIHDFATLALSHASNALFIFFVLSSFTTDLNLMRLAHFFLCKSLCVCVSNAAVLMMTTTTIRRLR